jgi:hypothetical protein
MTEFKTTAAPRAADRLSQLYDLKRDRGSGCACKAQKLTTEKLTTGKLRRLAPRSVLLPREKRFWPADAGLQWRAERLRGLEGAGDSPTFVQKLGQGWFPLASSAISHHPAQVTPSCPA